MTLSRRGFLGVGVGLLAAPAIVRAASLMPVRALPSNGLDWFMTDAQRWGFRPATASEIAALQAEWLREFAEGLRRVQRDGMAVLNTEWMRRLEAAA